jgi:hypothetical protein
MKRGDARKLARVVCYESRILRDSVRSDEQIELPDGFASSFEITSQHSVSFGCLAVERQD